MRAISNRGFSLAMFNVNPTCLSLELVLLTEPTYAFCRDRSGEKPGLTRALSRSDDYHIFIRFVTFKEFLMYKSIPVIDGKPLIGDLVDFRADRLSVRCHETGELT